MRRITPSILLTLSFSIVLSMSAVPANCQAEVVTIKFTGRVAGDCLLLHGGYVWGPIPSPIEWWGMAEGTAGISGLAEATLFQIGTPVGNTYDSENLEARGSFSLTWTEGESQQRLIVRLYSTGYTRGVFAPNSDYFTLPVGGDPPVKALSFRGIHISDQGRQEVEGIGLFGFTPNIFEAPSPTSIPGSAMILFDEVEQKMYTMIWLSQEAEIPLGPGGPMILVPAARVMQSNVGMVNRP